MLCCPASEQMSPLGEALHSHLYEHGDRSKNMFDPVLRRFGSVAGLCEGVSAADASKHGIIEYLHSHNIDGIEPEADKMAVIREGPGVKVRASAVPSFVYASLVRC